MLKGNLSTRPFYNERLASAAVGIVAVVVLLLTAYNATRLIALSSERRELRSRIERDQAEAARIKAEAATLQSTVDGSTLGRLAGFTTEANDLIDQRTFSWTAFFSLIERTLPLEVRLVMVSPRVERGTFKVSMTVVAQDLSDVAVFLDALLETGRFYDAAPLQQTSREDGTYSAVIEAAYLPPAGDLNATAAEDASTAPPRPPR